MLVIVGYPRSQQFILSVSWQARTTIVECRDLDLTDGNSCNLNPELLHLAMLLSVMLQSALDSVALGRRLVEAHNSSARAAVAAEVHLPG